MIAAQSSGRHMSIHGRTMVLPTWFPTRLCGLRPGGLPQDFLIHGAPNLLLYDQITCDPDSLAAELEFEGRFLSAAIYGALHNCRILQPLNVEQIPRFLSLDSMPPARADGVRAITTLMQAQLQELDGTLNGASRRARSSHQLIRLSPQISLFDTEMLIEFSSTLKGVAPYIRGRGKDNIWPSSHRIPPGFATGGHSPLLTEKLLNRLAGRPIKLLPEIQGDAARMALKTNIELERPAMLRWLLGDHSLSIENFHDWRFSDERIRIADGVIDRERVNEAQRNLEIILRARDHTSDVRREVQLHIDLILKAESPAKALDRLLDKEIREIADAVAVARDAVLHSRSSMRERAVIALEFAQTLFFAALGMAGVPNVLTAPADVGAAITFRALEQAHAKRTVAKERESHPLTSFRASITNAAQSASHGSRKTKGVAAIRRSFPVA
jgi:hypothetical protein